VTPLATIKAYYGWIDAQEIDRVLELFRDDALYKRAGSTMDGADALQKFFVSERKIRGRHAIENMWAVGNTVISKGRFFGVGAMGDARDVEFMDVWTFDDTGLVEKRETFLAHGYEIVRE
jgi:ketosteroid isomerase-like protein